MEAYDMNYDGSDEDVYFFTSVHQKWKATVNLSTGEVWQWSQYLKSVLFT